MELPGRLAADSYSTTEVRSITHTHLWTIKGFSQCDARYLETVAKIRDLSVQPSCSASLPELPMIQFRIRLHPQGNKESNKDFTFFQCFNNQSINNSSTQKAKFKFTVYNSRNEETATTVYAGTQQLHGYFEYIRRDVLISHIAPNDELQLCLTITVTFDTVTKSTKTPKTISTPPSRVGDVTRDLESIFRDSKLTDFRLLVGDQEIDAHKAILAARSPVFAAMLESHTEEAQKGMVRIEGIEPDVMHEMILYMYTGRAPENMSNALDLLAAADRFQLPGLKEMAEFSLRTSLTVEAVCRHLVFADMYSAHELRRDAMRFIVFNANSVIATDGYKRLSKDHPELLTEILQCLANDKIPSPNSSPCPKIVMDLLMPCSSDPPAKRSRMSII